MIGTVAAALIAAASLGGYREVAREAFPTACTPVKVKYVKSLLVSATAAADRRTCRVFIAPGYRTLRPYAACATMVHEYGHLAGLGHSDTPGDIMYWGYVPHWQPCDDRYGGR